MKEIKFRAWDVKEKRMFDIGHDCMVAILDDIDYPCMQFTGLKDKNGKEIYEGDIVKYDTANFVGGLDGLIEWIGSGFYIAKHIPASSIVARFEGDIEVIGNIYENPNLLTTTL